MTIRVLVVDDSALVRSVLTRGLAGDPEIEVVGTATDPYEARDQLVRLRPDVMTLDVEMPRMDGVTFLAKVMSALPTPTVILSSLTGRGSKMALSALEAGAVDVVEKPSTGTVDGLTKMMTDLIARVKGAARSSVKQVARPVNHVGNDDGQALHKTTDLVLGLGASTGGVAALGRILPAFPAWSPGIVIVQHMPPRFTADFADRLNGLCQMRVAEAKHGDRVMRGHILVAPGGEQQLEVRRYGGEYRIALVPGPPVSGHCPSVDVMFASLAQFAGRNAAACLLTGMGADGAAGLLRLRVAGGKTFSQDRETSAVWGMPAAAAEMGACERQIALEDVPTQLLNWARSMG